MYYIAALFNGYLLFVGNYERMFTTELSYAATFSTWELAEAARLLEKYPERWGIYSTGQVNTLSKVVSSKK